MALKNRFKWQNILTIPDNILGTVRKGQDVSTVSSANQVQTWILSGPCAQHQTSIPQINAGQIEFGFSGWNQNLNKCEWYFPPSNNEYKDCFYENNQYLSE